MKVSKYLQQWQQQGTALYLQSGLPLSPKPDDTILSADIYQLAHFIHVPAAPSMPKQQTYFRNGKSSTHAYHFLR